MKFLALLIFCGSVENVPVIGQHGVPVFAFEDEIKNEDGIHLFGKKTISDQCPNLLELKNNENFEQPSRLSLPTPLMSLSNEDESQDPDVNKIVSEIMYQPVDELPLELGAMTLMPPLLPMRPRAPLPWSSWMKDMNYMQDPSQENLEGLSYQFPSYTSENIVPPVKSLPPVSMHIHESLMEIGDNYVIDDSNIENDLNFIPNVRAVRSRDEEVLEQLKHEMMIPNIIPTMPIPFVRTAASQYQASQDAPLVMVIFPERVSDCALPLLFGCSPNIAYGRLVTTPDGGYPPIPPAVLNPEYRKVPDAVKSHEVNQVL